MNSIAIYLKAEKLELLLILLLAISILFRKRWLALVMIGGRILIHTIATYEIYHAMTSPFLGKDSLTLYGPLLLRQLISIIILFIIFIFQIKKEYKKSCMAMIVLLVVDILTVLVYFPKFMDYFMNHCEYCTKNITEISPLEFFPSVTPFMQLSTRRAYRFLLWTASAPFYSGSIRILITFIETLLFALQYRIYKKRQL